MRWRTQQTCVHFLPLYSSLPGPRVTRLSCEIGRHLHKNILTTYRGMHSGMGWLMGASGQATSQLHTPRWHWCHAYASITLRVVVEPAGRCLRKRQPADTWLRHLSFALLQACQLLVYLPCMHLGRGCAKWTHR